MTNYETVSDLRQICGPLSEEGVAKVLQQRFNKGIYHTWCGPVLLSVNSCQNKLPQFKYHGKVKKDELASTPNSPNSRNHDNQPLCQLADRLIAQLRDYNSSRNLAVVLSGLSGSGKSKTCLNLIRHIFHISTSTATSPQYNLVESAISVLQRLCTFSSLSNPTTGRNGTLIELFFNEDTICSMCIDLMIVDDPRIWKPPNGQRNFNIFYDMLSGCTKDEMKKLHLDKFNMSQYNCLGLSADPSPEEEKISGEHYQIWKDSLFKLGLSLPDIQRILAAILLLGNVKFIENSDKELEVVGHSELRSIGMLTGSSGYHLYHSLAFRTIKVEGTCQKIQLTAACANRNLQLLARTLYIRTIFQIVKQINILFKQGRPQTTSVSSFSSDSGVELTPPSPEENGDSKTKPKNTNEPVVTGRLLLVDFWGFEEITVGGLSELCCNFVSETLFHLQEKLLHSSSREVQHEVGLPQSVSHVTDLPVRSHSSMEVINMLAERNKGIMDMLSAEVYKAKNNDLIDADTFHRNLQKKHKTNGYFVTVHPASNRLFGIDHFCGRVVYDSQSLISLNYNYLSDDITNCFRDGTCSVEFLRRLFQDENKSSKDAVGEDHTVFPRELINHKSLSIPTFVDTFQHQLSQVLRLIMKRRITFLLCLKPSSILEANAFDKKLILKQLGSYRVLNTLQMLSCGYSRTIPQPEFIQRYNFLLENPPSKENEPRQVIQSILRGYFKLVDSSDIPYVSAKWIIGRINIYLNEEMYEQLELLQQRHLATQVAIINSHFQRQAPIRRNSRETTKLKDQKSSGIYFAYSKDFCDHGSPYANQSSSGARKKSKIFLNSGSSHHKKRSSSLTNVFQQSRHVKVSHDPLFRKDAPSGKPGEESLRGSVDSSSSIFYQNGPKSSKPSSNPDYSSNPDFFSAGTMKRRTSELSLKMKDLPVFSMENLDSHSPSGYSSFSLDRSSMRQSRRAHSTSSSHTTSYMRATEV